MAQRRGTTKQRTVPALMASKLVGWRLVQGDIVDPQLKQLMKELGDAINESLSDSEQISEVVSRIKEGGYDIFLVLEATIGVSKQGEKSSDKTSLVTTLSTNPEFKINDQDLKFLKSLRIKIEEEKNDPDRPDKGK
jgi:pentose-5-phosphate-3-epimerase